MITHGSFGVDAKGSGSAGKDGFNNAPGELVQNPDLGEGVTIHLEVDNKNLTLAPWADANKWFGTSM